MPRANRHHIPGQVWHITHRCHKREFLLKFAKDRKQWIHWLYQAKVRYKLSVLNYMVTSNHIHLLVVDGASDAISRGMQLVAGRTAQAFNRRKGRQGAFWEDRYHAAAIERGEHLLRCLVYMDMNMVRAGAVTHPSEWPHCGHHEILSPPQRYRLIDREQLIALTGAGNDAALRSAYQEWIAQALARGVARRRAEYSEALAVGSEGFVVQIKERLGVKAQGRRVAPADDAYTLREPESAYSVHFDSEKDALSDENSVYFDENLEESVY